MRIWEEMANFEAPFQHLRGRYRKPQKTSVTVLSLSVNIQIALSQIQSSLKHYTTMFTATKSERNI
jgi:hypothetical protein